jgi:hypothetical protein
MRVIPNESSWIAFTEDAPADLSAPTTDELAAAKVLTSYIVTINPTSTGNAIPIPNLDSLFDSSTIGTSQGAFSGDFYRDDEADDAWDTLKRGVRGYFFISRFGGSGTDHMPAAGEKIEVWPVAITQRAGSAMASNTVQTFTLTAAVPEPPAEDAVVASGTGAPGTPDNLTATPGAAGIVELDWDAPPGAAPTSYRVYHSATAGGTYTEVTTNITKIGTTAALTAVTPAGNAHFYRVAAQNAAGTGSQSAPPVQVTVA